MQNAHFWQVGLLDIFLSEYPDNSGWFQKFHFYDVTLQYSTVHSSNFILNYKKGEGLLRKSKILFENVTNKSPSAVRSRRKSCRVNMTVCLFKKEQMILKCVHNRDTVPLRGPLRASGGSRTSLVWISKPVVSRLRRKPYRCRYFTIVFSLFSLAVAVSTHLCVACHHFYSIVAVQGPCGSSEFTLMGLLP